MIRVFVISQFSSVRDGVRTVLEAEHDCRVIGEAIDLERADEARLNVADLLVVESGTGVDLDELIRRVEAVPTLGLIVLGQVPGDRRLPHDLEGRAWAYLPRQTASDQLVATVRAVAQGLVVINPEVGGHLIGVGELWSHTATDDPVEDLTPREREVLQLVALGLANKMIAHRLSLSEHTVKFHVASILTKLNAASRTEAVTVAARRGLIAL